MIPATESDRAVTAVAFPEIFHGISQILLREIRPELRGYIHLRVRKLPEKEIREAHLAGGPDEQVRIGIITGVEMFADIVHVDHRPIDVAGFDLAEKALNSIDNFEAAAIT